MSLFPNDIHSNDSSFEVKRNSSRKPFTLYPTEILNDFKEANSSWYQSDSEYYTEFSAPGATEDDIDVFVDEDILNIKADYSTNTSTYSFHKKISVPENTEIDSIKANLSNGILYVSVPKKEDKNSGVKEIEVNA